MQPKWKHVLYAHYPLSRFVLLTTLVMLLSACGVNPRQLAGTAAADTIYLPIIQNPTPNTAPVEPTAEEVDAAFAPGSGGGGATRWRKVEGGLKMVSVGSDGAVWGVNHADEIYQWNGNGWTRIEGGLNQISVGSANHIWGVNDGNEIWYWTGTKWTKTPTGFLKQVDVGCDGTVWGVNSSNQVWRWDGAQWLSVSNNITYVAVGNASNIWGIGFNNEVFRWNGSSWVKVEGSLQQLDVGCDGAVWGIDASNWLYRWNGNMANSSWLYERVAAQVSVHSLNYIWIVDQAGAISYYRR